MKTLLILFSLSVTLFSFSGKPEEYTLPYSVDSSRFDSKLNTSETGFTFTFFNLNMDFNKRNVLFSVNGENQSQAVNSKNQISIDVAAGSYLFQFYYSGNYTEIRTDSISGKNQYRTFISVYFESTRYYNEVEKPVIYLYPEVPTIVEVKIKSKGELTFTYPEYKDGWKINADPSGDFTIEGKEYNYLFWESKQMFEEFPLNYENGFIVARENTIRFLEEKLTAFGLNSEEKTDFITYWGPQLIKNEKNFVHFVLNDDCNDFATLDISPKPDHVYRIYLLFSPLSATEFPDVNEQRFKKIDRSGFTVIEWGGSSIEQSNQEFPTRTLN